MSAEWTITAKIAVLEQLTAPALGQFPGLEKALAEKGVAIPKSWGAWQLLVSIGGGLMTLIRQDRGLPAAEPGKVELTVVKNSQGRTPATAGKYSLAGFRVESDGLSISGFMRLPGFYPAAPEIEGIPVAIVTINDKPAPRGWDEGNLLYPSYALTEKGERLVDFIAGTIGR